MEPKTHLKINQRLCGVPKVLEEGYAEVELVTTEEMVADEKGLIHGGFVFGLGDYAAMLAVNEPTVVLAGASVKFLKPAKVGDVLLAKAKVIESSGKKRIVEVAVFKEGIEVFKGEFICVVPERHVLEK